MSRCYDGCPHCSVEAPRPMSSGERDVWRILFGVELGADEGADATDRWLDEIWDEPEDTP
jgi:hypothetical protein